MARALSNYRSKKGGPLARSRGSTAFFVTSAPSWRTEGLAWQRALTPEEARAKTEEWARGVEMVTLGGLSLPEVTIDVDAVWAFARSGRPVEFHDGGGLFLRWPPPPPPPQRKSKRRKAARASAPPIIATPCR